MGKLKRIYGHTELKTKFLFTEEELKQRDDKEFIGETSFVYDENTKKVYYMPEGAKDSRMIFKGRLVDNDIVLED